MLPDNAKVFFQLYWVLTGLIWLAMLLGFPLDIAASLILWLSAALLFIVAFFRHRRENRVFIVIIGLTLVACALSSSFIAQYLWLMLAVLLLLFRMTPFWEELCKLGGELFDKKKKTA